LAYDLFYIRNYSIWADLQILVHVVRYLLKPFRGRSERRTADEAPLGADLPRFADVGPLSPEKRS
jgi:hypothetical protein